jgi:hypothetical protein
MRVPCGRAHTVAWHPVGTPGGAAGGVPQAPQRLPGPGGNAGQADTGNGAAPGPHAIRRAAARPDAVAHGRPGDRGAASIREAGRRAAASPAGRRVLGAELPWELLWASVACAAAVRRHGGTGGRGGAAQGSMPGHGVCGGKGQGHEASGGQSKVVSLVRPAPNH